MKKLLLEWKHFDKDGATCTRCSQTGSNLEAVIEQLKIEHASEGIDISFQETKLPESQMSESNQILINGVLLEKLIPNTVAGENYCDSCSDLLDDPSGCNCRTVLKGDEIYEAIPVSLIKQAITNMLHKDSDYKFSERKRMNIQVFGSGCASCKKLHELTVKAVEELGLKLDVEYNTDVTKIIEMGVMSSPVLAIDGKPALVGFIPDIEKIKEIISTADKGTSLKSDCCSCGGNC